MSCTDMAPRTLRDRTADYAPRAPISSTGKPPRVRRSMRLCRLLRGRGCGRALLGRLNRVAGAFFAVFGARKAELAAGDLDVDFEGRGLARLADVDPDRVVADLHIAADHVEQLALQHRQEIGGIPARPLVREHD